MTKSRDTLIRDVAKSQRVLMFFESQISGITRLIDIFNENIDFFGGRAGNNILDVIADKLEEILDE